MEGATAVPTQHKETPEDSTQLAASQPIDNGVTAATFNIELQNDVDIIPKDRLPSTSIHVLEKISDEVHVDVQATDFESSDMEHSTPPTPLDIQSEAHQGTNNQHAEATSKTSQVPIEKHETHASENIQSGLELWARIREYDQQTATEGLTQVLSKKQQQAMKKQALGKPHYKTRAKGGHPPTA